MAEVKEINKKYHPKNEFKKGHKPWNKGLSSSWNKGLTKETDLRLKKIGQKISKTMKGRHPKNEIKVGQKLSEEHKRSIGKGNKNKKRSERCKQKHSKAMIKLWQDSEFVKKQMKARGVKPNKTELKLNQFLQRILPKEYKFVGDGEFILAGKCPDFVNVNGQKKIIELYGNYWHENDNLQIRIDLFRQYGYETLIVWESELKDKDLLKEKFLEFNRGGG